MPDYSIVSGAEVIRTLDGSASTKRQRRSHVILGCGDQGCAVPLHREVKCGMLGGIVRQSAVTPDNFIRVPS